MPSTNDTSQYGSGLGEFYKGGKAGHQYGTEAIAVIGFVVRVAKALVDVLAYPWLMVLRHEFGERFLSGWLILFCSLVISFVAVALESPTGKLTAAGLALCWAMHKRRIQQRNTQEVRWHSRSNGISRLQRLLPKVSPDRIDLFYEPFVLATAGLLLAVISYALQIGSGGFDRFGLVMAMGAVCVHLHHQGNRRRARHLLLDQIDSQILSENLADALTGDSDVYATDGFVVQGAEQWSQKERQTVMDAVMASAT